jgi:hypothetical protein
LILSASREYGARVTKRIIIPSGGTRRRCCTTFLVVAGLALPQPIVDVEAVAGIDTI